MGAFRACSSAVPCDRSCICPSLLLHTMPFRVAVHDTTLYCASLTFRCDAVIRSCLCDIGDRPAGCRQGVSDCSLPPRCACPAPVRRASVHVRAIHVCCGGQRWAGWVRPVAVFGPRGAVQVVVAQWYISSAVLRTVSTVAAQGSATASQGSYCRFLFLCHVPSPRPVSRPAPSISQTRTLSNLRLL
jgi:hypothetical protein